MDILDRLLEHDAAATRLLLALCRDLTPEQWHQEFKFGQGSLYRTLDHFLDSQEYWTALMSGQPGPFVPPLSDPERASESLMRRFEAVSDVFLTTARQVRDAGSFDEMFLDTETGPARRSYGACIVHVVTHSQHHRAQARVMLDLLGVEYNPFAGYAIDGYPLEQEE